MAKKAKTKKELDTPVQIIISQDKYDKLSCVELFENAKSKLISWMKHWLIIVSITIGIIGTIGLNFIVATVVKGFIADEIEEVKIKSGIVEKSLRKSSESMDKAVEATNKYTLAVKDLEENAKSVSESYKVLEDTIKYKVQVARSSATKDTKALQGQIAFLKERIEKLETSQSLVQSKVSKEEDQKLEIGVMTKVSDFEENSKYTIELSYFGGFNSLAPGVARSLEEAGFQTLLSPNAARDVDYNVGVPQGTLSESKEIVLVYDGQDSVAKKILDIVEKVKGIERPTPYKVVPRGSNPYWMVLFFPPVPVESWP